MDIETMEKPDDPVCGMQVDPASAAGSTEYDGRTYYFCSSACKREFDGDPERYAGEQGSL